MLLPLGLDCRRLAAPGLGRNVEPVRERALLTGAVAANVRQRLDDKARHAFCGSPDGSGINLAETTKEYSKLRVACFRKKKKRHGTDAHMLTVTMCINSLLAMSLFI
jgi:hypothetical protein